MNKPKPDLVDQAILQAAGERFQHYGYGKTTMAEIAKDCDMSAANLYRYFKSKLEIGAALAQRCLGDEFNSLEKIINDKKSSVTQRLELFILSALRQRHEQCTCNVHINEMVSAICQERKNIVQTHMKKKQALLAQLLEEGNQLGEFDTTSSMDTAEAILTATTLLDAPVFMPMYSIETFEAKAKGLIQLLLNGLYKR